MITTRTRCGTGLLVLAGALATAGTTLGEDLFVAGTIGAVYKGDSVTGGFEQFGSTCLAPVQALACDDAAIYAGDLTGAIIRFDLVTGEDLGIFCANGGVTAMVMHESGLLVSDAGGTILRFDPVTGIETGPTLVAPITVQTMLLDGDDLYVSGPVATVYWADVTKGDFVLLGDSCLAEVAALALDETSIYAGDVGGGVARLSLATGNLVGVYWLGSDVSAMQMEGADLLVSESNGTIRRVEPVRGTELAPPLVSPIPVEAMLLGCQAPASCVGDLDDSGEVAFADLLALLAAWGPCVGCPEDIDGNGEVDFQDLLTLLFAWGPCE